MALPRYKVIVLPGRTYVLSDSEGGREGEAARLDIYMLVGRDAFEMYYSKGPLAEGSIPLKAKVYNPFTGEWVPYELRLVKALSIPLSEDYRQG